METKEYRVESGALVDVPVWENHQRGRNWAAFIQADPTQPGGLRREFWEKARGEYFYIVPHGVKPPRAVEFGADYYSRSGNPSRSRSYGVIVKITDSAITIEHTETARQAILREQELLRAENERSEPSPSPPSHEGGRDIPAQLTIELMSIENAIAESQNWLHEGLCDCEQCLYELHKQRKLVERLRQIEAEIEALAGNNREEMKRA